MPQLINPLAASLAAPPRAYTPLENTLLGVVDGSAKLTSSLAAPVAKAAQWVNSTATSPAPTAAPTRAPNITSPSFFGRIWQAVNTNPNDPQVKQYLKGVQANNTHSLATSLQNPTLTKAGIAAENVRAEAAKTSAGIYPSLSSGGKIISGTMAMLPDLLLSGGAKKVGYKAANVVQQGIRAVGEGKAVPQAVGQALIPGNSLAANAAANLISDQIPQPATNPQKPALAFR